MNGGERVARFLKAQKIPFLFTLCGGHISPILVACKRDGIRVVDTRHEATAVFAADAFARLTGMPGVAAVTVGPGVTNTITAIKNAQLAQSPVVLLGGATATILKGRGALQDIDQMALMEPHVKWATSVKKVSNILPTLEKALHVAQEGVPGPVFVELPVDLLYDEPLVREWYLGREKSARSMGQKLQRWYLQRHLNKIFRSTRPEPMAITQLVPSPPLQPSTEKLKKLAGHLTTSERPVILIGSQITRSPQRMPEVVRALEILGVPVFLSGMARGLLGRHHPLHIRHQRRQALKEADLIILVGVPCDFRLDYGRQLSGRATYVAVNRNKRELTLNRKPNLAILADPAECLIQLAQQFNAASRRWEKWLETLQERDRHRVEEIRAQSQESTEFINPLLLLQEVEEILPENSILIGDGGDFVASASYILHPRRPLSWLDPGVFGTLGVGAGFALAAKLVHPDAEVWILYGDGAAAFSLMEYDTFVRHRLPVIGLIGNDGSWMQIAREQVEILKDDVGTTLRRADYHQVARALGGEGLFLKEPENVRESLKKAQNIAAEGTPVLVNAWIGKTSFRKGSISM